MKHILINATNLTGSGALAIGLSLLLPLVHPMTGDAFMLLLPDQPAFRALRFPKNTHVVFFKRRTGSSNDFDRLKELLVIVPRNCPTDECGYLLDLRRLGSSGIALSDACSFSSNHYWSMIEVNWLVWLGGAV